MAARPRAPGFAAACSEHPVAAHAVGEVVGQVLDQLGEQPDLALLFATAPHTGAMEDVASAVHALLRPGALAGTTAVSVAAGGHEVEDAPGIALWAARLPDPASGAPAATVAHVAAVDTPDGTEVRGLPDPGRGDALLLLADPFSFPVPAVVDQLADQRPDVLVAGGMASAARGPGGNRLVVDDRVVDHGAVVVRLDATVPVRTVVSQGCRPIGEPMIATRAERNVVHELAGRPSLERLLELVEALDPDDRELARQGLHVGQVIDERKETFDRGDFLVRNVLGADRSNGAVAVGGEVEVGSTLQFHVRDAASADEDLRALLAEAAGDPAASLLFTCNGRGEALFGEPDHDARTVSEATGGAPLAGMFCAGELGPVGGRTFVHGFTASVVLFDHPDDPAG